ncbi:hypothetical protein [Burkholderia stagnalis]|uniref:hypothetical protein n=1 Tax=Burkholderia stagnalis TaxID=1503054 RepID=UPI0012D85808|nr:hypothetical protein [Burkholderia stagnalis]
MLKTPTLAQHELERVTLEERVPKDHLLRQIDAAVDVEFIRDKVARGARHRIDRGHGRQSREDGKPHSAGHVARVIPGEYSRR